jgi:hypothetical protein
MRVQVKSMPSPIKNEFKQTDLRAGANSAWSRGARWLIQRHLLEQPN